MSNTHSVCKGGHCIPLAFPKFTASADLSPCRTPYGLGMGDAMEPIQLSILKFAGDPIETSANPEEICADPGSGEREQPQLPTQTTRSVNLSSRDVANHFRAGCSFRWLFSAICSPRRAVVSEIVLFKAEEQLCVTPIQRGYAQEIVIDRPVSS